MRLSVKLKHLVERELDFIVQLAEKRLTKENTREDRATKKTEESQFRNLQNIASATDSILVLENFLRYQMGRRYIDEKVGNQILEDIKTLKEKAEEIAKQEGLGEGDEFRAFLMEFVRLYLGFFVRALKAEEKGGDANA
ncbi:hypothetical protein [Candidatus Caldatribacterium sp.]|uniref:hypothetical protein n=1 Tax=Candidatus Caldatribacterium sp. TaxID=2282143 RepID=UPI003840A714|nr:hypothetical protein [Candidatus Caldatribacterium sp.]